MGIYGIGNFSPSVNVFFLKAYSPILHLQH